MSIRANRYTIALEKKLRGSSERQLEPEKTYSLFPIVSEEELKTPMPVIQGVLW
jgi:hypothetical protein